MKILVTGAEGMLGKDLVPILKERHEVIGVDLQDFDLRNFDDVRDTIKRISPDSVVHCAAMTNVDGCEANPDQAFAVNALGSRNVAIACQSVGASMILISTDFVFDGTRPEPYNEFDSTNPISVYGRSKLAGERYVERFCAKTYILRTAWLYGRHGWNFVDWVIKTGREKGALNIVNDQKGSPTYTVDLSRQIENILATERFGIYHSSGLGSVTRFDWTRMILDRVGLANVEVTPIASAQLNQKAKRPGNSCLDLMALRLEGICVMRPWEDALVEYLEQVHKAI